MVHHRHGWNRSGHDGGTVKKKQQQQTPLKEVQSGIGNESGDASHLGGLGYYQILPGSQAAGGEAEMRKSSDSPCILAGSSLFPVRTTVDRKVEIHCTSQ